MKTKLLRVAVPGLVLAGVSCAHAEAPAPVEQHWPTGAEAALIVRHPNLWADAVDAVDARFGDVPAVKALAGRLREEAFSGLRVGARDWGAGLDLDRGLALYKAPKGLRLVVGARDPKTAEASARTLHLLEPLTEGGQTATCRGAEGVLVCESGEVTGQGAAPAGVTAPEGALAWFWAGAGLEALANPGVRFQTITGWLTRTDDRFALGARADFAFDSAAKGMPMSPESIWAVLTPTRTPGRPSLVAPECSGVLKLDFDLPRLLGLARTVGANVEPALAPAVARLEQGLTGEIAVTFDGGVSHPVLLLGLAPGAPGDAALTGIAELVTAAGGKSTLGPCADAAGQQCLEIAIESAAETPEAGMPGLMGASPAALVESPDAFGVYLTLHAVRVGDTLVLATTAPDAARRTRPDFVSAPWPQALAGAGASGLSVPGFAGYAGIMGAAPFIRLSKNAQWFLDAEILSGLIGAMIEGVDAAFQAAPTHARFELTWRTM